MKDLLYIAPLSNRQINSSGYVNASDGMLDIYNRMSEEGLLTFDAFNLGEDIYIDEKYNFGFLNINIGFLVKDETLQEKYKKISEKCDKFFISVVFEAEPLPENWHNILKADWISGFLCPSDYIFYLLAGYDKPCHYYPHFVNDEIFNEIDITKKKDEDFFTVLTLGQNTERKSFKESIIAFSKALGKEKDCRLIIKSNTLGKMEENIKDVIARYSYLNGNESPIYLLDNINLSQEELVNLYNSSSTVLLPSKAEGFGLNLPEAMLCGLPCIYTNYSAWRSKFFETKANKTIHYCLDTQTSMSQYGFDPLSIWCVPQIDSMCTNLIAMYNFWKEDKIQYYQQAVEYNRQTIIDKFGYGAIKKYILNIIKGE